MQNRKQEVAVKKVVIKDILIRYLLALIFGTGFGIQNFFILSFVFTPLTFLFSFSIFKIIYGSNIMMMTGAYQSIIIHDKVLGIFDACIALAAYYLLFMLNMLCFGIPWKKRIKMILFDFALLFSMNIARIIFLGVLYVNNFTIFDITHKLFWYVLSTIFVVLIWFLTVRKFNIKSIPFYSDFVYIKNLRKKA